MFYMNEEKKIEIDHTQLVASESDRLMKKYGKEYLDCKDLMQILGVGKDNVRALMRSRNYSHHTVRPTESWGCGQNLGL